MPGLWLCLIILHVGQAFEDTLGSKCARALKWHGCICNDYIELWICRNMPEYALMSLNMPDYD